MCGPPPLTSFERIPTHPQEEKSQLDGRRVAMFLQTLGGRSQDVLALLVPFSVPWFAEFFMATLLRVSE